MPSGGRRYDPDRRQRIIDAALRVVGERGIAGLTHRSAAAAADVPLGSTTYHFKTLDDLLVAALRQANEGFAQAVARSTALADPDADLAEALARLLGEFLAADRGRVELEYELYLAALRRPALRPVAAQWCEAVAAALTPRTDPVTARALVAAMDGIGLQVLLTDAPYDEAYAREILGRLLRTGQGGAGSFGASGV
ncbi:TetR/AcrR family transcriptional regulator [Streptomyces virginiae]|uniref:TetR/AcrR family transcriptional regulator n=1 Tax=Streptomyces virginiae TaxID=1961 RepID=UPI00225B89F7|nr:TetR family transcriptional regulator [Streptomyces virginiae]MCX4962033.1 TetR family transcriptional regulator [Streptomyces virginiae]MCX5180019.1 TetR family transcriptional regulator [Streptomyces virginiae]